jgi:hypothetical protein
MTVNSVGSAAQWQNPATAFTNVPNPDTQGGSAGVSNTFALGDHSHPRSGLYDGFGIDQVNVVVASGSTVTIPSPTLEQTSWVTLTANCTFTFPAAAVGQRFDIYLTQDGTGSRVPTLPANIGWTASTAPTWSTTAGYTDHVKFKCIDGANWIGEPGALGVIIPPTPLNIVQSLYLGSGQTGQATFANNITAGNGILALLGVYGGNSASPSGGGMASWTQIGLLANPASAPSVAVHGTGGSTVYTYEITYVNALGETIASSTVSTGAAGNATLSGSNYNIVSWTAAPAGASDVNVYGRVSGSLGLLATVAVGTTTWNDTGGVSPGAAAPSTNTTGNISSVFSASTQCLPQAWLGTDSTGGAGTTTITFGTHCLMGELFEIQPATLDASSVATAAGSAGSGSPFTTPTVTAGSAGEMPWVVVGMHLSIGTAPTSPWTSGYTWDLNGGGGYPTGGLTNQFCWAYQASTTQGGTYSSTWTPEYASSGAWASLSFLLKG